MIPFVTVIEILLHIVFISNYRMTIPTCHCFFKLNTDQQVDSERLVDTCIV